jgi:hypothetical protein
MHILDILFPRKNCLPKLIWTKRFQFFATFGHSFNRLDPSGEQIFFETTASRLFSLTFPTDIPPFLQ